MHDHVNMLKDPVFFWGAVLMGILPVLVGGAVLIWS